MFEALSEADVKALAKFFSDLRPDFAAHHEEIGLYDENVAREEIHRTQKGVVRYGRAEAQAGFILERSEGTIIGALRVLHYEEREGERVWKNGLVDLVGVSLAHRRQGVGKRLLQAYEQRAFSEGRRDTLHAIVSTENFPSRNLFEGGGYEGRPYPPHIRFVHYSKERA
jgi:GNAT superfamily N-acetyltransferase